MDETKLFQSMLDTAISTSNELLVNGMRYKAETRVLNDMIGERDYKIRQLESQISDLNRDMMGIIGINKVLQDKVGHMDKLLLDLKDASKTINELRSQNEELLKKVPSEKTTTVKPTKNKTLGND